MRLGWLCCLAAACGAAPGAPRPAAKAAPPPSAAELRARHAREERTRRDAIVATHRKLEAEEQDALAATCPAPGSRDAHPRCLPSCYPTEPADPRAGKRLRGRVAIEHLVCIPRGADAGSGPLLAMDELAAAKLHVRPVHGRLPRAHRAGSWQATLEARFAAAANPGLPRGDALRVAGGWRGITDPRTGEALRCVTVWHYTRHGTIDGCGTTGAGDVACEATGDVATRGLDVAHYRLAEARRLRHAGDLAGCQQAALEAVAVARGLPRWRQYVQLNIARRTKHAAYRTRFDGTLDEDALFATAAALGRAAQAVYAACGGPAGAPTTPAQEQSFHTCW